MIGLDRFAIEVEGNLYSRLDQGGSILALLLVQPDMRDVAPAFYAVEKELFNSSPGLYMKHESLDEFSCAPDDHLFLVRQDNLFILDDGSLVAIDNEFLARQRGKSGCKDS